MRIEDNRRRLMRVHLDAALRVRIGQALADLIDISLNGARVVHSTPLANGKEITMHFEYAAKTIEIVSRVVRCRLEKTGGEEAMYVSGVHFIEPHGESMRALREMISDAVTTAVLHMNPASQPQAMKL